MSHREMVDGWVRAWVCWRVRMRLVLALIVALWPAWAAAFGSFAAGPDEDVIWFYLTGEHASRGEGDSAALKGCWERAPATAGPAGGCRVVAQFRNQCMVVARGASGTAWSRGDLGEATQKAFDA